MNKFAFNLSKFKKIGGDKSHTVLQHEAGHTLKIAHAPLSPKLRGQLAGLSMAKGAKMSEGGEVDDIIKEKESTDKENEKRMESGEPQLPYTAKVEDQLKKTDRTPASSKHKMADGGEVEEQESAAPEMMSPSVALPPVPTAFQAPQDSNEIPDREQEAASMGGMPIASSPLEASKGMARGPASLGPEMSSMASPPAAALPGIPEPSAKHAYDSQVQGTMDLAKAEASAQNAQAKVAEAAIIQQKKIMDDHAAAVNVLNSEYEAIKKDVADSHIDPDKYIHDMSTGQKVGTAIGLILSGIGSGMSGQSNMASKFLNDQIDRNIAAQRANLGKKESLLSAAMKQFGNERDATQFTIAAQRGIVANQIMAAGAKANNPIIMARAKLAAGQLEAQNAPIFQQLAMRKSLEKGGQEGADPAEYVRFVVPEPHQKEVFGEIQRAQDTRRMSNEIMKSFDTAKEENTVMKTGAGLLRTPASVYALHQALQPTFKDLEGTVRQAAMDNTFKNVTPAPGDTQHTIDTKRIALGEYLKSKASAPTAKGFGIDLDKFQSTKPMESAAIKNYKGVPHQLNPKDNKWYPVR